MRARFGDNYRFGDEYNPCNYCALGVSTSGVCCRQDCLATHLEGTGYYTPDARLQRFNAEVARLARWGAVPRSGGAA